MTRALMISLAAAAASLTGACQRAEASPDRPAAVVTGAPVAARLTPRHPESRERIQPGRIRCKEPVASIPASRSPSSPGPSARPRRRIIRVAPGPAAQPARAIRERQV